MDHKTLHQDALVIDTHNDTATHLLWRAPDISQRLDEGHVDIPRLREGGVDAAYKREVAEAEDPEKRREEIEADLRRLRTPWGSAERFGVDSQTVANRFRSAGVAVRPRRGWTSRDPSDHERR